MHRTQIYLTDLQQNRIAQIAVERQSSKAAVIGEILDQALGNGAPEAEDVAIIRATSGICSDHPEMAERGARAERRRAAPIPRALVFDTTVLIAHLRGEPRARELLVATSNIGKCRTLSLTPAW